MSDTVQQAADFITKHAGQSWRWEAAQLAQAMHDAGLLADPTTSRTDAEQAVIDAAKRLNVFVGAGVNDRTVRNAIADLCAAVDRLTATEGPTT